MTRPSLWSIRYSMLSGSPVSWNRRISVSTRSRSSGWMIVSQSVLSPQSADGYPSIASHCGLMYMFRPTSGGLPLPAAANGASM